MIPLFSNAIKAGEEPESEAIVVLKTNCDRKINNIHFMSDASIL